jgi:signal peptidase I
MPLRLPKPGPRSRRALLILAPFLLVGLWYSSKAVGYVANLRAFTIPAGSNSMTPALLPGDRFTVDVRGGDPRRGEIWIYNDQAGMTIVKRVIGLPGETVEVKNGRILIDGELLAEPYLTTPPTYSLAPTNLKPGQYFVLGDNRDVSLDSHLSGPVPVDKFLGRAEHRFWPNTRVGPVQ